jgi:hypothetical protein
MKFIQVQSSTIDAVKHDNRTQKLTIRFTSGSEYEYDGVGMAQFYEFLAAESQGRYFAEHFKQLPTRRIK